MLEKLRRAFGLFYQQQSYYFGRIQESLDEMSKQLAFFNDILKEYDEEEAKKEKKGGDV